MNIPLTKILPFSHSIRTTWDEEKMMELAQSVKEQGIIVPIKVRPAEGDMCEIVYGHRRVEAARRAGLKAIPAIFEGMDDTEALIQALIENIQREDMEPMDIAHALRELQDLTGWSQAEIARRRIMPRQTVSVTLLLLDEEPSVQRLVKAGGQTGPKSAVGHITREHVTEAREAGTNLEQRSRILQSAAAEGLSRDETRQWADAIVGAEDEAEEEAILETSPRDPAFQRLVRVKSEVKRDVARRERKERQENPREVKEYIEAVQTFSGAVQIAIKVAEFGKFSPEAGRFIKGWHDSIREGLARLEETWEDNDA